MIIKKLLVLGVVLACGALFTGCPGEDPAYNDPIRSEELTVVPSDASAGIFSTASTDPYLDGAVVIKDTTNFVLKVFNTALATQNRLEIQGNNASIAYDVNHVDEAELLVEVKDISLLTSLVINGQNINASDFSNGVPVLSDNEAYTSGARLPGRYAVVKVGAVGPGNSLDVNVSVTGNPELKLHFDAYGDVWGGRVLVTGARAGTTYMISTPVPPVTYALNVAKSGNGLGEVGSAPVGIDCGLQCSAMFVENTVVTLTAAPLAGSSFTGWTGACSGSATTCVVSMNAAKNVTANFALIPHSLAVQVNGTGTGTVTSAPSGINCGATCAAYFNHGTMVSLSAAASATSEFVGWSGACSGTGSCVVTISAATTVTATFELKSYVLSATTSGSASGTINSIPGGIDCGINCAAAYPHGTIVTLTATPAAGAAFMGWTGACAGELTTTCEVTMTAAQSVGAQFDTALYILSVTKSGAASGTVTSAPAGIDCGAVCSLDFAYGTTVTLTATPGTGATFTGWSGACTGTGACNVLMGSERTVNANFDIADYALSVATLGLGAGSIVSTPTGITCGLDCTENYSHGTMVTLLASPSTGSTFAGWSGVCTGTSTMCVVSIDAAKSAYAQFDLEPIDPGSIYHMVSVSKNGASTGVVTSSPAGINCGAACSSLFQQGSTVTLIATPDTGAAFTGWSGACTGTSPVCNVTANAAMSVTATFDVAIHSLTVAKTGTGLGTVTASDASIDCGSTCSAQYVYGTTVTLTAESDPSNPFTIFTGWTGACSGTQLSCTVALTENLNVGASFDTITQITIALNASKVYNGTIETWGVFTMPQRADIVIPGNITLSKGKTGNHVAALDFNGTVCCYKPASTLTGKTFAFDKCISGAGFTGASLNSVALFGACKDNTTPTLSYIAGSTIQLPRGAAITLLIENDDNRNPPVGSPNYEAIVQTILDVLAWYQP